MLSKSYRGLVLGLVVSCPALLRAAEKPDLSSPRKAATSFANALESGDADALKATSLGSEEDYKLMDSLSGIMKSGKKLQDAASEKFGVDEGKKVAAGGPNDMHKEIDQSEEKIDGEAASLTKKGEDAKNALKLKKVKEGWKVDLTQIPDKQQMAQALPMMKAMGKAMDEIAADIKSGKYKSADEAKNGLQQKMFAVLATQANQAGAGTAPQPPAKQDGQSEKKSENKGDQK